MYYAGILHESTQRWCHAIAPGKFVFRIQTAKDDIRNVWLHTRDKYLPLKLFDTRKVSTMTRVACDGVHDYFEIQLSFQVVCLRYCFELEDHQGNRVFYSNDGFVKELPEDKERLFDCPQTLREEELFQVPKWAKNKVIYQIFPSRFATDEKINPRVWYKAPIGPMAQLGGNLRGIIQRLDHIHSLGADVIYMTPIFQSKSSHKYDTMDYYTIDPGFGTEEDLRELVRKAHELGIRVILDGVFNHTSPDFFAFRDLKKNQTQSRYLDWYYPTEFPLRGFPKPNYKCFGYFGNMPKVNLKNPDAARYFIDVALYWLEKVGADGWRLDVADEIHHDFWRKFRREVKAKFPEALIVGEIWHHAPDFLTGDQWDSMMNYPFYRAVEDFAATGSITASEFIGRMGHIRGNIHTAAYPLLWNLIGSHDTPRLLFRCGEDKARQRVASAIRLLWPGMPMIYYGDEVAMTGGADPDCRRGMLWDPERQDQNMLEWYRTLIRLRKEHPAFTCGTLVREDTQDAEGLVVLERILDDTTATLILKTKPGQVTLPEFAGQRNLLDGTSFSGTVDGISALAFVRI